MEDVIRRAVPSDASAIRLLLAQLGYPDFSTEDVAQKIHSHSEDNYYILVGESAGKVIAFIALHWFDLMHWKGKMGRISAFCVDEQYRSQGIGKKLLKESERLMFEQGCTKIEVTSNERRTRTHEFYLKAGYLVDSKRFVKYKK